MTRTHLDSHDIVVAGQMAALPASGDTGDYSHVASKVELALNTCSIDTGTAAFDKHLQSESFFNTANFPTAKFVASNFRFSGDKVKEVAGQLTMLGKTVPVSLKASHFNYYVNPMLKREVCGGRP